MKRALYGALICALTLLCSCGGNPGKMTNDEAMDESETVINDDDLDEFEDDWEDETDDDDTAIEVIDDDLVMCPMCGGTLIAVLDANNPMGTSVPCPGCEQKGRVTREKAQEMNYGFDQLEALWGPGSVIRYRDDGSMSGGNNGRSSSGNCAQIEYELNKAINHLQDLERNMANNASNAALKAQYANMISEQRALIARLQQQLANCR